MGRELLFEVNQYIDYADIFSCPSCKDQPSVIILDGIAMGITKQLPDAPNNIDPEQKSQ